MQVTRPRDMTTEKAEEQGKLRREFFSADNKEQLQKTMKDRMEYLSRERKEVLVRRTKIEPEAIPIVVAEITTRIIMTKHKSERKRLKKELAKLVGML